MSRNVSDKVINEQGNVATFCAGADARLIYQNNDGELKKYLIEGEGGGASSIPSALIDPAKNLKYVDCINIGGYEQTITINTNRASSDSSHFKLIDYIDNIPCEIITINSEGEWADFLGTTPVSFTIQNCNSITVKGNTLDAANTFTRLALNHVIGYDEEEEEDYEADDFEINAQSQAVTTKIFSNMRPGKVNSGIIWTSNTGADVVKRQFELRCIQANASDDLKFQIVARTVDDQDQEVEQIIFESRIKDDGVIYGPDGNQVL